MLDAATAVMDPFYAEPTVAVYCDIYEPSTGKPYARCPRSIAKKAEKYRQIVRHRRQGVLRPRSRILRLRRCAFLDRPAQDVLQLDSEEGPNNSGREYAEGNLGHRPRVKGGYFPVDPVDSGQDLRTEMVSVIKQMGVEVEKHHHEVAPSQHELGIKFSTLVKCADNMQIYKYVVHNVARDLRQDGDLHAEARFRRQRLGHACASVDLEGRQAAVRRQEICRICRKPRCTISAASSSMPRR